MRSLLVVFSILCCSQLQAQSDTMYNYLANLLRRTDTLTIEYNGGGCFPQQGKLVFFWKGEDLIAVDKDRWRHYGNHIDKNWTTILSERKKAYLLEVLDTADAHGLQGWENGFEGTACYYIVSFSDSLYLGTGNCNGNASGRYGFDSIEYVLFRENFANLEAKRKRVYDSIQNQVTGSWTLNVPPQKSLKYGDTLVLSRVNAAFVPGKIVWTFNKDGSFKSTGLKYSQLIYSRRYAIEVDWGEEIDVEAGFKTPENKDKDFIHLGAALHVVSLSPDRLVLRYGFGR